MTKRQLYEKGLKIIDSFTHLTDEDKHDLRMFLLDAFLEGKKSLQRMVDVEDENVIVNLSERLNRI